MAFVPQMAYQAWVTNAQTVLRQRRRQRAQQEQAEPPAPGESGHGVLAGHCRAVWC